MLEVLCKLLEVDLCVLPFEQEQTWSFLTSAPSEIGVRRLHTATKYKVRSNKLTKSENSFR